MAFTLELGEKAPDFTLPGVDGNDHSLADFSDKKLLVVVFTCNHCPHAVGTEDRMVDFAKRSAAKGVGLVAINANETDNHPTDSMEHMKERSAEKGFTFPYLRDDEQSAALAYGALRTPHFYLFDADRALRYTGRFDDNTVDASLATTSELADAVDALLAGKEPAVAVTNPIGCNVKWKDRDGHWMPPEACDLVPRAS